MQGLAREVDGRDHRGQRLAEENQIGGRLAQMGGADRRHRDMRRGQRRRVVQAVADHHHLESPAFQIFDAGDLVGRGYARAPLADPQRARRRRNRGLPIARENFHRDAALAERRYHRRCVRAQPLAHGKQVFRLAIAERDE